MEKREVAGRGEKEWAFRGVGMLRRWRTVGGVRKVDGEERSAGVPTCRDAPYGGRACGAEGDRGPDLRLPSELPAEGDDGEAEEEDVREGVDVLD